MLRGRVQDARGLTSVNQLLELAAPDARGPAPTFAGPHVLLAFLTIAGSAYIGRKTLGARSGFGEGAARTVLKKLKEGGYVDVIRSGCYLTRSGKTLSKSIHSSISELVDLPPSGLTVGGHQAALLIPGAGRKVHSGIEQRDSAIRIGASGATTYVLRNTKFTIPGGSSNCEKEFPSPAWSQLRRDLKPGNGDAVVLCGADDEVSARLGALAAAITLL